MATDDLQLVPSPPINAVTVFLEGGLDTILEQIEAQVRPLVFDITTVAGRKECAGVAFKVAQSKVMLDNAGKEFVAKLKEQPKLVDAERKRARDFLDALKDEVRSPLTAWEVEEQRKKDEEAARIRAEEERKAAEAAEKEHKRIEEIERREAELKRKEEEHRRRERDEQIAREAAEKAKREAQGAVERAEREKIAVEERAKRAAIQAEIEKQEAIRQEQERARREAERVERDRLARENQARIDAERTAADREHRRRINREALVDMQEIMAMIDPDLEESQIKNLAQKIILAVADGKVCHMSVTY